MPYQLYKTVAFGSGKSGLATVGYQLYDSYGTPVGSRVSGTGIHDLGGGTYGALVTLDDGFRGRITWDTGETNPVFASEEVNPESTLNPAQRIALADCFLTRDWNAVLGEASRSVLNALRALRNRWAISGNRYSVTKEDDTTEAWSAVVDLAGNRPPVSGADPD